MKMMQIAAAMTAVVMSTAVAFADEEKQQPRTQRQTVQVSPQPAAVPLVCDDPVPSCAARPILGTDLPVNYPPATLHDFIKNPTSGE